MTKLIVEAGMFTYPVIGMLDSDIKAYEELARRSAREVAPKPTPRLRERRLKVKPRLAFGF